MPNVGQAEFYNSMERFFNRMMEEAPVAATQLGDHRFDHKLGDHSQTALERQHREIRDALAEFEAMNLTDFDRDAQVDHTIAVRLARRILRQYEKVRDHARHPGSYVNECLGGVFLLLVKDFAPLPTRLAGVLGRLREVPRVLAQGKVNLVPEEVPPVWAEITLDGARQGLKLFTVLVPLLSLRAPWLAPRLIAASRRAAQALRDYIAFLEREVVPRARGDFAVGKELFEELLRDVHMLDYTADGLLQTGWELFNGTQQDMESLARKIAPGKTAQEILDEAKAHHPPAGKLLDAYRREMAKVREFVAARGIVTIPEGESLKVEPTPPFLRGIMPYAAYMMPGPLEKKQEGIFLVTPVSPRSPRQAQEEKLQGHNYAKIPVTALHEAYPGHHLQLVYANRHAQTLPRKLGSSTLFVEGWAFYCEELMEEVGYIREPVQKLARLKDQLWRAARIILDVSLHTGKMTVEEGIQFLVEKVGLEQSNAQAEVRRYTSSPTQPMSYLIGKLELLKVIEEYKRRHPTASLREVHDTILSCGSLPPKLLAERLFAG